MITEYSEEQRRNLIFDYFGDDARVRLLRRTPTFGAPVFVVDFDRGPRHFRTLGSFGTGAQVTEQSSMDLLYPARLVFHYERLMSLALAMSRRSVNALLLGLGGAAMWRFIRAYLPDCSPTLVDADETIVAIARRWFYLKQSVVLDTAQRFVAGTRAQYDVILVDLYDADETIVAIARRWFYLKQSVVLDTAQRFVAGTSAQYDVILVDLYDADGPADSDEVFWTRCLDSLAPGGCLANNWADFAVNPHVRPMADALSLVAQARGLEPIFVTRRGFRDNLVQYVPTTPGFDAEAIAPNGLNGVLERFVRERHIPDRGRGILENCLVTRRFPIE